MWRFPQKEIYKQRINRKKSTGFRVRHPRCAEYKLKYNTKCNVYIMQSDTTVYFIQLY